MSVGTLQTPRSQARTAAGDVATIRSTGRRAGILYLVMSVLMMFDFFVPSFTVAGDPAATARRMTESALYFRGTVLTALVAQILFVFVVLNLYQLFRDTNRGQARLMVALVCAGVAAELGVIGMRLGALSVVMGTAYGAFTPAQQAALAYALLRVATSIGQLLGSIWGLWLFPFGLLTLRSRYMPAFFAWALLAAGAAWIVTFLTTTMVPEHMRLVSPFVYPLYFGELTAVLWLAIMGARPPLPEAQPVAG